MNHARRLGMDEIDMLGRYNSEVCRGLVHTKEWAEKMAHLQAIFNAATKKGLLP